MFSQFHQETLGFSWFPKPGASGMWIWPAGDLRGRRFFFRGSGWVVFFHHVGISPANLNRADDGSQMDLGWFREGNLRQTMFWWFKETHFGGELSGTLKCGVFTIPRLNLGCTNMDGESILELSHHTKIRGLLGFAKFDSCFDFPDSCDTRHIQLYPTVGAAPWFWLVVWLPSILFSH